MKPSKAKAIRKAARELYDLYHGFHMPDAPPRGAVDTAWDKLGNLIGRPIPSRSTQPLTPDHIRDMVKR